jgi:tetratricopeptide (TPR) repeat protein
MKRDDEALAGLNRAIELDPGNARTIASRGQVYQAMKRDDEALIDYNRAIELDLGSVGAVVSRGQTYRLMKRYDELSPTTTGPSNSTPVTPRPSPAAATATS